MGTPEAGSVKADKSRIVPVHSDLIRQGLLEFVKSRGYGPLFYKEDTGRPKNPAKDHPAKAPAKRLCKWVRDIGVKDPKVQPNHGWRHLFISLCREDDLSEEARYFIIGHTMRDIEQRYGAWRYRGNWGSCPRSKWTRQHKPC